jgi:hypothetical protein
MVQKYKNEGHDTIILAGAEYGSGSSRDWAAKDPMLQVNSFHYFLQLYVVDKPNHVTYGLQMFT